jgi:hypothetical protein
MNEYIQKHDGTVIDVNGHLFTSAEDANSWANSVFS